jgi:hypothetical protein
MPLPHCSINRSSWKTRPITRFRNLEPPLLYILDREAEGQEPGILDLNSVIE